MAAGPVPKDALDYFRAKDLRVGFSYKDVWAEEHAHAFTVAKATRLDILDDIRAAADQALADGETFRRFAKNLKPKLADKGWWGRKIVTDPKTGRQLEAQLGSTRRLKTIYDANMRSARAAGQWQRIQRTKKTLPYLVYELGPSEHHRKQHVAWAGLVLPVDHAFWRDHMPPNGYGCKCRVRQVSRVERQRLVKTGRYATEAPARDPQTWTNKRTGEQVTVDRGLDPAWAGNPGQDRVRVIREQLANKIHSADQQLARAAVRTVMNSPLVEQWMADAQGELPAGILDRRLQTALGADSQVLRLSAQTFHKQDRLHGELTAADYRRLPDIADGAIAIADRPGHLVLFKKLDGRWWKAVAKTTRDKKRVYLQSYIKTDAAEVRRVSNKGRVIRSVQQ